MTKEQKELYDKIVATGRLNEEQLTRLRAGFEKLPPEIDIEKSKLHFDKAMDCLQLEKIDSNIQVTWRPEDDDGDAYIYILVPNAYSFSGSAKKIFLDTASVADTVSYRYINDDNARDALLITFGFMGIIQDPNKSDNFTAN